MAQFQVPQFIETEDKIIGPLTLRQFLYLAGAGGASGLGFLIFKTPVAIIFTGILSAIGISFAFARINGRDLLTFMKSAFSYYWHPRLYIFKIKREDGTHVKSEKLGDLNTSHHASSGLRELGDQMQTSKWAITKRERALPPGKNQNVKKTDEIYEIVSKITGEKAMARKVDFR